MSPRVIISRHTGLAIVIAVVLARSFAPLYWSDLYFDSDQAVTGLMAKHIAEGRAFPVMQYGRLPYVLVLESWLAAPLMLLSDHSPTVVRLVPSALNLLTAATLYTILSSGVVAFSPAAALLATMPLAMPGPSATDELTAALGMNIEPLLFSLLIWLLRERPIALGVVAAIGVKNREFVLYAIAALVAVDILRERAAVFWRRRLHALLAFGVTWSAIGVLADHATPLGPATDTTFLAIGGNLSVAANVICLDVSKMPGDFRELLTELLPLQLGVRSVRWRTAGNPGAAPPDASWLWLPLALMMLWAVARGLIRGWRLGATPATWFGTYLVAVGAQAIIVYGATRCGTASIFTMRYALLSIFVAVGALVLGLERERAPVRVPLVVVSCLWFAVCAAGHAVTVHSLNATHGVGAYRQLAEYLEAHDIRFIDTNYWAGYHVAFLTGERVRAITGFDRVHEHLLAVSAHPGEKVEVRRTTERPCDGARIANAFYVCQRQTNP
jgi:hypothetical protein